MEYKRGDLVEISNDDEGFMGSHYEATIVTKLRRDEYIVVYRSLLKEDLSGPLREVISGDQLRPAPPEIPVPGFDLDDKVDAFHNDGWWVGRITGRIGELLTVFFDHSAEEAAYRVDRIRLHLDWVNGKWISFQKSVCFRYEVDEVDDDNDDYADIDDKGKVKKCGV